MEKRMKQLERCTRRWCSGYLLIENGHCLIEDEEGEIMLPESLQSTMICLKENDRWTKGELVGSMILHESGQLVEVQGGEVIQYTVSLAKGWLDLLMFVPENVFYDIIEQVEQLGFSVYDCVFSSFHSFQQVSFSFRQIPNHLPFNVTMRTPLARFVLNGPHLMATGLFHCLMPHKKGTA